MRKATKGKEKDELKTPLLMLKRLAEEEKGKESRREAQRALCFNSRACWAWVVQSAEMQPMSGYGRC